MWSQTSLKHSSVSLSLSCSLTALDSEHKLLMSLWSNIFLKYSWSQRSYEADVFWTLSSEYCAIKIKSYFEFRVTGQGVRNKAAHLATPVGSVVPKETGSTQGSNHEPFSWQMKPILLLFNMRWNLSGFKSTTGAPCSHTRVKYKMLEMWKCVGSDWSFVTNVRQ